MEELRFLVRKPSDAPGVAILSPWGALDARCAQRMAAALGAAAAEGVTAFVLDLEHVRYVNSAGLSALVRAADERAAAGGAILLAAPQPKVKVVLELMGLTGMLPLRRSVERALKEAVRFARAGRPTP